MSFINDERLLLVPYDLSGNKYVGYIKVKNEEFQIDIQMSNPDSHQDAKINCEWKLKQLLTGYENDLLKKLNQCSSLHSFLKEVLLIVDNILACRSVNSIDTLNPSSLKKIYSDIEKIGWDKLLHVDKDFQILKLAYRDVEDRSHTLVIQLNAQETREVINVIVDLPIPFDFSMFAQACDIKNIYEHFTAVIDKFQEFWNNLDEIDEKCWVLEPESIKRSCNYRTLALDKHASLQITLNPYQVYMMPEYKFIGTKDVISPMMENMKEKSTMWSKCLSVFENLESIVGIDIPRKATVSKEDVCLQCGICYSYRSNEEIPDQICEDKRCGQIFHNSCLIEWLRSRGSHRQRFNIIFGECPYCKKNISIRIKR